ncbi:MAG: hypothetical protein WC835_02840 [Candidatus Paceibacterota bacterium]|jgi:tRNA pseudouridine55 synthase
MNSVLAIYKQKGETPLAALGRLRVEKPEYEKETLSYAGRLDPMAEGVMLVLVGDANKEREKYLNLDKIYITQILCGVSTDTHDLLGLVTENKHMEINEKEFAKVVNSFVGEFSQKYPAYSSKTVGGTQLHELSRKGEMFNIPEHKVFLHSAKVVAYKKLSGREALNNVLFSVDSVSGDFRQKEIKDRWKEVLRYQNTEFDLFELELSVSSGFYVRQFASDIGEKLRAPALAYSIRRIKVAEWGIENCIL